MPFYFVMDGVKQEIDEDVFDQMTQDLQDLKWLTPTATTNNNQTRWNTDGTQPETLDPNYFNKYHQKDLKSPFTCPDCGRTISNKSNLSKHRQANVWKRHQQPPWHVANSQPLPKTTWKKSHRIYIYSKSLRTGLKSFLETQWMKYCPKKMIMRVSNPSYHTGKLRFKPENTLIALYSCVCQCFHIGRLPQGNREDA